MEETLQKLEQLAQLIQNTKDNGIVDKLDDALDYISGYDYFGTEGQNDPRGDQRDAEFVPYDEDDEDSDGEYEYFRVETVENAIQCLNELVMTVKEDAGNFSEDSVERLQEMIEDAFADIFNHYGLN